MVDLKKARQNLENRYESKRISARARFDKATLDCSAIVCMISAKYRPERIYQWGSLLHSERFDENSDIDLAVEGIIEPEAFFDLIGEAMKLSNIHLDIVQIEKIEPEFATSIRESGRVVYERS
jgi:predicted nucleotidyltransferase